MKTWIRAVNPVACGGPHDEPRYIQPGEPMLQITITLTSGTTVTFLRCQTCEGPCPPDLPANVARRGAESLERPVDVWARLRKFLPQLPIDFKARQNGDHD